MKNFLLQILFLLLTGTAYSQAVAWELSGEPGNQAASPASFQSVNFTNCSLQRGAGVTATSGIGSMNASGWFGGTTPTTLNDAITGNDYYEFTCNVTNCLFFNLNSIKIVLRSSATGPNTATLRCSSDGFAADLGTVTVGTGSAVHSFSENISPNAQSVTYRLYGYGVAAGGGTPSAGGTMRIGSSVVAGDNDIELFGSTTFVSIGPAPNITVTSGDFVPATVLSANVPGATVNWSRTAESIGLGATSGTGNIPAFTAFNNTALPITSTFTANATAGNCTGPDMMFTVTVDAAVCNITVDFFGDPSPCNDNGTPNDPSDDFFTQNVHASFFNRPLTGSLEIVPGGDQIGTYSIPVGQIIGNAHTFNNVQLKADGTTTILQMDFTDNPACIDAATGPTVQPCSTPVLCAVNGITLQNKSGCNDNGTADPADDFFTADVRVTFSGPPATGNLEIELPGDVAPGGGATSIPVASLAGGEHIFTGVRFKADGTVTVIEVDFTADQACVRTATASAVQPCSVPPPVLSCPGAVSTSCQDQVPAVNPASVSETHTCPGNLTITHLGDVNSNVICINKLTITRTYQATDQCGKTATCSQTITINDQTPPTVTCPAALNLSCATLVPAVDVSTLGVTDNCTGGIGISRAFLSEVTSNQLCTNRFTLVRIYRGGDACGNTATCTQTITVNDQTGPALTCPAAQTLACASQVPAQNIALVTGVSDNCGGAGPTVIFFNEAISNQSCANRFSLTRIYRATDICGNSATCSQIITVNDQTGPGLSCPIGQTVSCAELVPGANPALVTGLSDNCGGATPSVVFLNDAVSNQSCANRFTLTRSYRATDACGNSATCSQVFVINDQTPPSFTAVPANTTVDCYLVPGVGIATASDNCTSGATVTFLGELKTPGICPVFYTLTRTWRATDACGNSATASQVVTVTDFNAPQFLINPQKTVVECSPDNAAKFQAFLDSHGGAVAEDCAPFTFTYVDSPDQNNAYNCGLTFQKNIRFIATDACGNSAFRDATFTVVDLTPPVFSTPPQNVALECAATGDNGENDFYTWLDANAGLVAEDACGDVVLEKILVGESQGCGHTWQKTYEFRAKDLCGNLAKTTATFAVVDHTAPTLFCPPNESIFFHCLDDVPAADPSALSADDCSGVQLTLQDTWTNGSPCPGSFMTVAYRYAATDACGNQAVCERAFYVQETNAPTLVCPDTIKLACADDIPGPLQLFAAIKNQLQGNCPGGFTSITILSDSGQPQNGGPRTYTFTAKNHCGWTTTPCSVTFAATGACNQLCTASQTSWGDPNGTIGGMNTKAVLEQLLQAYGPLSIGGGGHTVSAPSAACVQELLAGAGNMAFLPTGHYACPLPPALANADGSINNQLAANALALQLNIWYNLKFNHRDLGIQDIHLLPDCLVEYPLLKDLGQHSTIQEVLDLTNLYLQGFGGNYPEDRAALLTAALDNFNYFRVDCALNAPCERPGHRLADQGKTKIAGFQLAPNPATETVTLTFESVAETEVNILLSDGRGLRFTRKIQTIKGWNSLEMDLKNLPAGVYWVSLKDSTTLETLRLVKVGE